MKDKGASGDKFKVLLIPKLKMNSQPSASRKPIHPGKILKHHYLEPLEISNDALAKFLGISPETALDLVNGKVDITLGIARELSIAFGTTQGLWLNLQQNFDTWGQNNPQNSKAFLAFLESEKERSEVYRRLAES